MVFDLKGSTFNRSSKVTPNFWREELNEQFDMKDNNFNIINKDLPGQIVEMDIDVSNEIVCSIESDSQFLRDHGLMDYSLLLVVESCKLKRKPKLHQMSFPHRIMRISRTEQLPGDYAG